MIQPFVVDGERDMSWFIPVDKWTPNEEDKLFQVFSGSLRLMVTDIYHYDLEADPSKNDLNFFAISSKRCYGNPDMRIHLPLYLNYFEKFYDQDKELIMALAKIKCSIDLVDYYPEEQFISDVCRYILSESLRNKAIAMSADNYIAQFDQKNYRNDKNIALIYQDKHARYLMWMSLLMNMCIPVITHYIYQKLIDNTNEFILKIFRIIIRLTEVDMYNKFYETATTNVGKDYKKHERLWSRQDIRGLNIDTHALECIDNIIINIMPKYTYSQNVVSFNFTSIKMSSNYKVTGITYEFDYIALSSSIRDADNNSVYDKYESFMTKQSEALYLMNKVSSEDTIKRIRLQFGPFDQKEIDFYKKKLANENGDVKNPFQLQLISNLFFKYFGDPIGFMNINNEDYIMLLIAASRLLKANNMVVLPYVISSKIDRLQTKKTINKREQENFKHSEIYPIIEKLYNDSKIIDHILGIIGTILSSKFTMIDYNDSAIDGKVIDKDRISDIIAYEVGCYVILINQ